MGRLKSTSTANVHWTETWTFYMSNVGLFTLYNQLAIIRLSLLLHVSTGKYLNTE